MEEEEETLELEMLEEEERFQETCNTTVVPPTLLTVCGI